MTGPLSALAVIAAIYGYTAAASWLLACRPSVLLAAMTTTRARRARHREGTDRRQAISEHVSARLDRVIMRADRHTCTACPDNRRYVPVTDRRTGKTIWVRNISVDHRQPWAGGGLTWAPNGAALCRADNITKGNYNIDADDGYIHMRVRSNIPAAQMITRRETAHCRRWSRRLRLAAALLTTR